MSLLKLKEMPSELKIANTRSMIDAAEIETTLIDYLKLRDQLKALTLPLNVNILRITLDQLVVCHQHSHLLALICFSFSPARKTD